MKVITLSVIAYTVITLFLSLWSLLYFDREPLRFEEYTESQRALTAFAHNGVIVALTGCAKVNDPSSPGQLVLRSVAPRMEIRLKNRSNVEQRVTLRLTNVPARQLTVKGAAKKNALSHGVLELEAAVKSGGDGRVTVLWNNDYMRRKTFFVCGDPQFEKGKSAPVFEQILAAAARSNPLFIAITGDIVESGSEEDVLTALSILEKSPVPVFTVPGNHDTWKGGRRVYERYFGPFFFSFDLGSLHYVFLDTAPGGMYPAGQAWLDEDLRLTLKADRMRRLLAFSHFPTRDPRPKGYHAFFERREALQFLTSLGASRPLAIFSGHVHGYYSFSDEKVPCYVTAGAGCLLVGGPEHGFPHFLEVAPGRESLSIGIRRLEGKCEIPALTAMNTFIEPIMNWCFRHFVLALILSLLPLGIWLYLARALRRYGADVEA